LGTPTIGTAEVIVGFAKGGETSAAPSV
jgi:hypothetical protein